MLVSRIAPYDAAVTTALAPAIHVVELHTMVVGDDVLSAISYSINGHAQALSRTFGGLGDGTIEPLRVDRSTIGPPLGATSAPAQVLEVLIYDRTLSSMDREVIIRELRLRHGL